MKRKYKILSFILVFLFVLSMIHFNTSNENQYAIDYKETTNLNYLILHVWKDNGRVVFVDKDIRMLHVKLSLSSYNDIRKRTNLIYSIGKENPKEPLIKTY